MTKQPFHIIITEDPPGRLKTTRATPQPALLAAYRELRMQRAMARAQADRIDDLMDFAWYHLTDAEHATLDQETQPMTHPEWRNKLDTDETVLLSHINGSADPVFQTTKGWFFWDETWTSCFGPFDTQLLVRAYLRVYAAGL